MSFHFLKKQLENDKVTSEKDKKHNDCSLIRVTTVIHNICFFCYDEFNSRYSDKVGRGIKKLLEDCKEIFKENMRFLFEIGLSFPNENKKQNVIINALFPLIVINNTNNVSMIRYILNSNMYLSKEN